MRREESPWWSAGFTKVWWKSLTPVQQFQFMETLSDKELESFYRDWRVWGRDNQLAPEGDANWSTWLRLCGRGEGKTRSGSEHLIDREARGYGRMCLLGQGEDDVREVMVEGESGVIACAPRDRRPKFYPSVGAGRLEWPSGAVAFVYSAADPEALRGPQFQYAWCFIAGTMVSTPDGERPIETLRPGDFVLTRKGPKAVLANSERRAPVGCVTFANGASLVGTADHPIYESSHGWTRLDGLEVGDSACAIAASNGTASSGIATATATTSAPTRASNRRRLAGSIARYGSRLTAFRRRCMTSTIRTTIAATTISTISSCCLARSIAVVTRWQTGCQKPSTKNATTWFASTAASLCSAKVSRRRIRSAPAVRGFAPTAGRFTCAPVSTVDRPSKRSLEISAVSVASTWRPAGETSVFCLKVAEQPEYFANGILVHNCDEPLAFQPEPRAKALSNLRFGLRLKGPKGEPPQLMYTTTPKPHRWLKDLVKRAATDPRIRVTRGSTLDNIENLSKEAVDDMRAEYEGTQLGRQELYAEILSDEAGALFHDTNLDKHRILPPAEVLAGLERGDVETYDLWLRAFARTCEKVVVGVDPNTTDTATSHAAGIVVAGKKAGRRFTIKDASIGGGPRKWSQRCIEVYEFFDADELVVEVNQGGDLVKMVVEAEARLQSVDIVFKKVRAWKGKRRRAEPVAAAYERGDVSHIGPVGHEKAPGPMYRLETQLCALHDGHDPTGEDFDRGDANNYAHQRLGRKGDDDSETAEAGGGFFAFGELAGVLAA